MTRQEAEAGARTVHVDGAQFGGPHAHELADHELDVTVLIERHVARRLDAQVKPAWAHGREGNNTQPRQVTHKQTGSMRCMEH